MAMFPRVCSLLCICAIALFFFLPHALAAQSLPPMETDRPDETEGASLVPVGFIQIEAGFHTERLHVTDNGVDEQLTTTLYPSLLVRYGVLPTWELRLQAELQSVRYAGTTTRGFAPLAIGTKIAVCEEQGLRPTIAFLGHLTLPFTGIKEFRPSFVAPQFRFAAAHTLSPTLALGYNLGMEWDGESAMATTVYTAVLGVDMTDDIGIFAELFGALPEIGTGQHHLHVGATWSVLPNLQADIATAIGLNKEAPEYGLGIGISARFPQ